MRHYKEFIFKIVGGSFIGREKLVPELREGDIKGRVQGKVSKVVCECLFSKQNQEHIQKPWSKKRIYILRILKASVAESKQWHLIKQERNAGGNHPGF